MNIHYFMIIPLKLYKTLLMLNYKRVAKSLDPEGVFPGFSQYSGFQKKTKPEVSRLKRTRFG